MESVPMMSHMEDVESGGKYAFENDFNYRNNVANAPMKIRLAFIRKVYSLLSIQIGASVIIGAVCMLEPHIKGFIQTSSWMVLASFILSIAVLIALHVYRRETPTNFVLLAVFTVIQAYSIGVVVSFFDTTQVLTALGLTFIVVAALTTYTFQSKRDFTSLGFGLFAASSVLLFGMIINIVLGSTVLDFMLSIGGALLFSLFIVYDTKMLMENLSAEEYILATISLYLDIVNLFLYILHIIASSERS